MNRYPLICIEGIDGVGKTAISHRLADLLGASYYKTPPPPYDSIRTPIDHSSSVLSKFLFYLSAMFYADTKITALRETRPVVCDRYYYSTFAYHAPLDSSVREFRHILCRISTPDYAVLITANEQSRRARLGDRCPAIWDSHLESQDAYLAQVQKEYLSFDLDLIDTTDLSIESTTASILERIKDLPLKVSSKKLSHA